MGLELVRSPLPRPFSWDARRQGFSCSFSALFSFSPFRSAATLFLEGPGVVSLTRRVVLPTPRRSDSQGKAQSWAGALDAPFLGILSAYFVCQRVTGTLGRPASGTFSVGEGAFFSAPSGPIFHTHFFFPPQVFFFFLGRWGQCLPRSAGDHRCHSVQMNDKCGSRDAPRIPRQFLRATLKIPRKTRRLPNPVFCPDFCRN